MRQRLSHWASHWAALMALGEVGGGLSLARGLFTPLDTAGIVGAMVMAIFKAHWRDGFWNAQRGFEYPLQLLAVAVTLGLTGPGSYALDTLARFHLSTTLFLVLAAAAVIVDALGLRISGQSASTTQPA